MRNIVVPVDFSEDSAKALQKAVSMARKVDGVVCAIHVNKVRSFLFGKNKMAESPEEVENSFKGLLSHVPHDGVEVNYVVRTGQVTREVVKYAEEVNAYIILMGTHGATGFHEHWMGSNAYRTVTHAHCPVLTVRGEDNHTDIKRIVLPVDTSSSTRHKVPFTLELAQMFDAEVHVLGVSIDSTEVMKSKILNYMVQIARMLKEYNIKVETEFLEGSNIATIVMDYAKKVDADLISIMTEMETTVATTFLGPFAQQIVHHSTTPVLTMHRNPNIEGSVSIM